jgi:L-alanine-DL-glutamate epimerase-like enolase superfamily enzyme
MKIQSFSTSIVSFADRPLPIANSPGARHANFVTLRLGTDDGIEGIGYAGFVPACVIKALYEVVYGLAELVLGDDPLCIEAIGAKLLETAGAGAPAGLITRAVAAIDVALWDIRGKAFGKPVYQLLGGFQDRVPTYASGYLWRTYDLAALAEWAPRLVEQGFRAMKLRMGAEDSPAKEIERLRVVRHAVGPDIDLMVDINQGWDVNQSISIGRALEKLNLYWLEDPTHHLDYEGLARIAAALDTPLAAGEYVYGIPPFTHLVERRSIDIVMIDLLRAGGLTPFLKIAHLAEAHNLPVVSHLAPEILCHALAAIPNGLFLEHMPWSFGLFKEVPQVENGQLVLPQKPGLGLEFV